MPAELQLEIFEYLAYWDVTALHLTCRRFRELLSLQLYKLCAHSCETSAPDSARPWTKHAVLPGHGRLTPLHWAAGHGRADAVEVLLRYGAPVNEPGRVYLWTPLLFAAEAGDAKAVALLLQHGADVAPLDAEKRSALHWAVLRHREKYSNSDAGDEKSDDDDEVAIVRMLLKAGADTGVADCHGETPLHAAVDNGAVRSAAVILEHMHSGETAKAAAAAVVGARNYKGMTALHMAAATASAPSARLLLQYGADVDAVDDQDWTPLHHVAVRGDAVDVVKLLLEKGADRSKINQYGLTPWELAVRMPHGQKLRALFE